MVFFPSLHVCVRVHVCACMRVRACVGACMRVCVCACMSVRTRACVCVALKPRHVHLAIRLPRPQASPQDCASGRSVSPGEAHAALPGPRTPGTAASRRRCAGGWPASLCTRLTTTPVAVSSRASFPFGTTCGFISVMIPVSLAPLFSTRDVLVARWEPLTLSCWSRFRRAREEVCPAPAERVQGSCKWPPAQVRGLAQGRAAGAGGRPLGPGPVSVLSAAHCAAPRGQHRPKPRR